LCKDLGSTPGCGGGFNKTIYSRKESIVTNSNYIPSTLTEDQKKNLDQIKGRATSHELVLTDGTRTYCLGYTVRSGRQAIITAVCDRWGSVKLIACSLGWRICRHPDLHGAFGGLDNKWSAKFSGRTRRQAIIEGEHLYIPKDDGLGVWVNQGEEKHGAEIVKSLRLPEDQAFNAIFKSKVGDTVNLPSNVGFTAWTRVR